MKDSLPPIATSLSPALLSAADESGNHAPVADRLAAENVCAEHEMETQAIETEKTETEAVDVAALDAAAKMMLLEERVVDLEDALDHRERQIHAMQQMANSLLSLSTPEVMVRETLTLAIEVLTAEAGSFMLHNPVTDTLVFRHVIGPTSETLTGFVMPVSQGIAGRVFSTGVPHITHKAADNAEFNAEVDQKTGFHTESMMTVPVKRANGTPIGVMQIINADVPFDSRDLEVLQVMAAQASAAIENARLLQEGRKAEIVNVIGDISHDIKNMLTPIQSGVWTLEPMLDDMFRGLGKVERSCPPDQNWGARVQAASAVARDNYSWILQASLSAAEKVQQRTKEIADAVRGESSPPFFELGDLNEIVQEVARSLQLVVLDAHIDLELELEANLPQTEFDRKQMYSALYNLANNAIPETPPEGRITLRTQTAPEGDAILIEVQDSGRGMPEHVRLRLFTDEAVSTKPGGTGLGTRIVGGVVRRHNGKILVDSEPNRGTTFTIRLPLRPQAVNS